MTRKVEDFGECVVIGKAVLGEGGCVVVLADVYTSQCEHATGFGQEGRVLEKVSLPRLSQRLCNPLFCSHSRPRRACSYFWPGLHLTPILDTDALISTTPTVSQHGRSSDALA